MIAFAASGPHVDAANAWVTKLEAAILFPLMILMSAVAMLVFLWGMYEYVLNASDQEARSNGKQHMLYGIIGLLVMISAYGILKIAAATFGITS